MAFKNPKKYIKVCAKTRLDEVVTRVKVVVKHRPVTGLVE
jgi:hypothetical protein